MFVISHFLCTNFGPNFHQACDYARPDELWQYQVMYPRYSELPFPPAVSVRFSAASRAFAFHSDLLHRIWDHYNFGHAWNSVILHNFPRQSIHQTYRPGRFVSNFHDWLFPNFSLMLFSFLHAIWNTTWYQKSVLGHNNFGTLCYFTRGSRFIFSVKSVD